MKPAASTILRRRKQGEQGAVIVEFALVLPLLALLLGGGVEVGLLARDHQVLQNAAREGARFSALPVNDIGGAPDAGTAAAIENRIKSDIQTYLQNEGITAVPNANITVNQNYMMTITVSGVDYNVRASEITIVYPKSLILPGLNLLADPVNLVGRAVFRNFY